MNYKCIGCKSLLDEDDGTHSEAGFECDACNDARAAYELRHASPPMPTSIEEYRAMKGEKTFLDDSPYGVRH